MNDLNKKQIFIIFCLEGYIKTYQTTGADTYNLFKKYAVFTYIEDGYDVLHTQSINYVISEINDFIKNRKQYNG